MEIIVVDGDPGGSTINSVRNNGVILQTSAKGRARQMNHGAKLASGEIFIFLHADTFLPDDALLRVRSAMNDTRYVAGAFDLGINSDRSVFRITEWYAALRTRLTRIPFGDQAIFIRSPYFAEIGGYSDIPLMEDIDLMKRIRKHGQKIFIIADKVMTSPRRWEQEGIFYCTLRNWALQICFALGLPSQRLTKWYK